MAAAAWKEAGIAVAGVAGYDGGTEGVWEMAAAGAEEDDEDPKRPRMSSTEDF
jgi:hypothetical protein